MAEDFILISPSRSGSTAVRTELDKHPGIACLGEILAPAQIIGHLQGAGREDTAARRQRRGVDPGAYLKSELDAARSAGGIAGFKLLFQQFGEAGALRSLAEIRAVVPHAKAILLWRRDLLARYRSEYLYTRKRRRKHFLFHGHTLLDPEYIRLNCEWQETKRALVHSVFGEDVIELAYEDFLEDPGTQYAAITNFLGAAPFPFAVKNIVPQKTKRAPFIDKMLRWHTLRPFGANPS